MTVRYLRLTLGLFFLVAGAGLLAVRFTVPEVVAKFDPLRLFLGAAFALVLGGWNLTKWYAAGLDFRRSATPGRRPIRREPGAAREEAPNPDFDFGKREEPPAG